ncbi:hypothetical protein BDN72DRAFT_897259 [Pluteus cervinus]|uniref:Uncharacterized protein n=1 Tax=Pluteus cervinus TaxID=181527 RepID=A0ACD3AUR4_9AGAR|nr:hypothetical protein BDN72DRAFT_897259 [Pluteus cervinus]
MGIAKNEVPQPQIQAVDIDGDGDHGPICDGDKEHREGVPILPPELEQRIFTLAFHNDGGMKEMQDCCDLLLVAKKTFEWVAPLVYKIVIIHSTIHWPPMGLWPDKLQRYGKYVRHLLLEDGREANAKHYLTHCTNITNLALINLPRLAESHPLSLVAALPLKELSIDIRFLPESSQPISSFASITHLDLAYFSEWDELPVNILSQFPSLTHLMMLGDDNCTNEDVNCIIEQVPELEVFILVSYIRPCRILQNELVDDLNDLRVVGLRCTFVPHWKAAAQGLENPWSFAEEVIAKRRKNELDGAMT